MLRNLRKLSEGKLIIRLSNEDKVQVEQIGVISLYLSIGYCLKLKNVIFVLSVRRNLVSTTCLDQNGYFCYFENKIFKLFHDSSVVGTSTLIDGLYRIDLDFDFDKTINIIVGNKMKKNY